MKHSLLASLLLILLAACAPAAPGYPRVTALDLSGARTFDPAEGERGVIRYVLSAPALVRVRIVDGDTPGILLRTLVDWEPRPAGACSEVWDGRDAHGDPVDLRRVSVLVRAEPQREALSAGERQALAAERYPEEKHFLHPAELCRDLTVHLEQPVGGAVVAGEMAVQAALSGNPGMPDGEYHVVVYLDGRDAWDGRVQEPRFSRAFDTSNVPNGEHLLAVTFNDLHDHAGSDWAWITVQNP